MTYPALSALPFVTIAIPCFNEERFIEACIDGVLAQDYPPDRTEVVIADGMSVDSTRGLLSARCSREPRVRFIDNPARIQAAGMNAILRIARGDVIVRMDAHCEYAPDYVRTCVAELERTGADNVGGAQRIRAKSRFQRALGTALQSPIGAGGAKYRSDRNEGFVDTVFLGAFRRSVFESVGLYDPRAATNEDAELNQRILQAGGRIYMSRDIVVHYFPRSSFRTLARQYFAYGKGRARTLLKHRSLPSWRPAVPFALLATACAVLALPHPIATIALALYAAVTAIEAARVGRAAGLAAIPIVWTIFPVLHASHGLGFAVGLVQYGLRRDWGNVERLGAARGISNAPECRAPAQTAQSNAAAKA